MRRSWLGFRPAVFPSTSLILPSFQWCAHAKLRLEAHNLAPSVFYVWDRAEVTEGAQRAVGFRRRGTIINVALRCRFAYSLEHYDSVYEHADYALKPRQTAIQVNVRGRIITHRQPLQGKALRPGEAEKFVH